ncbi:MAG TPA: hypothetical protein VNC39_08555 [Acidocella sp.]|uniref:hypothetical protein n=1 Tax=Acidocella sp. TaxID=50710 RepID=UPI002CAE9033|nr:hypothetical protein [Acidocella sp.]HVE22014.1 hypothetical protein [Acidocella sp.]
MTRFPGFTFAAPCLVAAAFCGAAHAQTAADQRFQASQFVAPGQLGQIDPHRPGGALACPSIGVLSALYNQAGLATGANANATVAGTQIAAVQAGCVTLPPGTVMQVLSFYPLGATTQTHGAGYLQVQSSTTHGAQWVGAGVVLPLPATQSGPAPSAFGIAPSAKPPPAPAPAAQSLPQPNQPAGNPPAAAKPQSGAPTMALPPAPPASPPVAPAQSQPDGYVPLPVLPPASAPKPKDSNGACSDLDSLLNATKNGHGCTQP